MNLSQNQNISIPVEAISEICRQYGVRRLALFGSASRDDFAADSDIDVLVEFQEGQTPGLGFFALQNELTSLFQRPVDLNTAAFLSPYFRQQVLDAAVDLYVAA